MRPVTRIELLDHIEAAFSAGAASPADLLDAAVGSAARPEVIELLHRLPDTTFRSARDLWYELGEVPMSA